MNESGNAGGTQRGTYLVLFLIVALAFTVYWLGNSRTPLWDRDEPRFAEAAREMLHTRDFVVPHFNGEVRYDKPILGYYAFAAGMAIFGENEFGARAFSGIFGALSVIVFFFLARRITSSGLAAVSAAGILAFSPVMVIESKLCTVDALLLFLLLLAFTGLWRIYEGPCGWGWKALFWAALALAVLTKGPVAIAAVFVPVILLGAFSRDRSFLKRFGWLWGVPLFVAVAAPWAILVQRATAGEFLRVALGKHVVGRSMGAMEGHRGFPGYYVVTLFGTFFPWAFFLPATAWFAAKHLGESRIARFLSAWAVGLVIVLECVKTKMIHYALPVFPALALLVVLFVVWAQKTKFKPGWSRLPAIFAAAGGVVFGTGTAMAAHWAGMTEAVVPLGVAGAFLAAMAARWIWESREWGGLAVGIGAMTGFMLFLSGSAIPAAGSYGVSKNVAATARIALATAGDMRAFAGEPGSGAGLIGYEEPSLVFYLRGARFPREPRTLEDLKSPDMPKVLVVSRDRTQVIELLGKSDYREVGSARGFNFAKGKAVDVSIWSAAAHE